MVKINYGYYPSKIVQKGVVYTFETKITEETVTAEIPTLDDAKAYFNGSAEVYFRSADVPCDITEISFENSSGTLVNYTQEATWNEPIPIWNIPGYWAYRLKRDISGSAAYRYSDWSRAPVGFGFYCDTISYDTSLEKFTAKMGIVCLFTLADGTETRSMTQTPLGNVEVVIDTISINSRKRTYEVAETVE